MHIHKNTHIEIEYTHESFLVISIGSPFSVLVQINDFICMGTYTLTVTHTHTHTQTMDKGLFDIPNVILPPMEEQADL